MAGPTASATVGVIYLITNKVNQKVYIGQTTQSVKRRFLQHSESRKSIISNAIRKYGIDSFSVEFLAYANVGNDLDKLEVFYISLFNAINRDFGYNISLGGNGVGKHSPATKSKMSRTAKLRLVDKTKHNNYKKVWSDDFKEKLREANLGKKYSKETNMKKASFGKKNGNYTHLDKEQIDFILDSYSNGKSYNKMRKDFLVKFGKTISGRKLKKVIGGDF